MSSIYTLPYGTGRLLPVMAYVNEFHRYAIEIACGATLEQIRALEAIAKNIKESHYSSIDDAVKAKNAEIEHLKTVLEEAVARLEIMSNYFNRPGTPSSDELQTHKKESEIDELKKQIAILMKDCAEYKFENENYKRRHVYSPEYVRDLERSIANWEKKEKSIHDHYNCKIDQFNKHNSILENKIGHLKNLEDENKALKDALITANKQLKSAIGKINIMNDMIESLKLAKSNDY